MDTLLTKQRIHVYSDQDKAVLMVGNLKVDIPYASSFKIAQGLRLAAKDAMRYAKEDVMNWREMSKLDDLPDQTTPYKIADKKRISVTGKFQWKAGWEGENVKVMFGNNLVKFHFTAALKVAEWLRVAGREAKSWAGDGSKSMISAAILSNAEENYKLGVK